MCSADQQQNLTQLAKQWINFWNLPRFMGAMEKYLWLLKNLFSLLAVVSCWVFYFDLETSHNWVLIQRILTALDDVSWIWKPEWDKKSWTTARSCWGSLDKPAGTKASTWCQGGDGRAGERGREDSHWLLFFSFNRTMPFYDLMSV